MPTQSDSSIYSQEAWREKLKAESISKIKRRMKWDADSVISTIIESRKTLTRVALTDFEIAESEALYQELFAEFAKRIVKRHLGEIG